MRSSDRAPACPDCDWTGFRQVLVIAEQRTVWAAPCDCAGGRSISHPTVPDEKLRHPMPFHDFADMHRRKGHEVIVTDRHESRIALKDSNPEAWARAQAFRGDKPNPYQAILERIRGERPDEP